MGSARQCVMSAHGEACEAIRLAPLLVSIRVRIKKEEREKREKKNKTDQINSSLSARGKERAHLNLKKRSTASGWGGQHSEICLIEV